MKTILITGIGGDISQGVATILRESRPEIRLIGVDMHCMHGGHLFVDCAEVIPRAVDPEYTTALAAIINKYHVDIVMPMTEPELSRLRSIEEFPTSVKWITAGERVVTTGLDKLITAQALAFLGLSSPWTHIVGDGPPRSYPCILKSRHGSGSRGVFRINSEADANYYAKCYPGAIFQELLEPSDKEVTCAVYRNREKAVSSLLMLRRLTGGFTGWAKIIDDDATVALCSRVAEGLDLQGCMNIQLRLTKQGPRVFEINPRFSSTVLMRHRIGFQDVLWAIDEAEGKRVIYPKIAAGTVIVRVQGAAFYKEEDVRINR